MNLADFEPKPHPAKRVLKSNGVKISTVARALDLSSPTYPQFFLALFARRRKQKRN